MATRLILLLVGALLLTLRDPSIATGAPVEIPPPGPPAQAVDDGSLSVPALLWRVPIGTGAAASPLILNDGVYAAGEDGNLRALEAADGEE